MTGNPPDLAFYQGYPLFTDTSPDARTLERGFTNNLDNANVTRAIVE